MVEDKARSEGQEMAFKDVAFFTAACYTVIRRRADGFGNEGLLCRQLPGRFRFGVKKREAFPGRGSLSFRLFGGLPLHRF